MLLQVSVPGENAATENTRKTPHPPDRPHSYNGDSM